MAAKRILVVFLLTFLGFVLNGCLTDPDLEKIECYVAKDIGLLRLKPQLKLNIGPFLIGSVRFLTTFANVDEETKEYLAEIHRVEIGIFEIENNLSPTQVRQLDALSHKLKLRNWQILVKCQDDQEYTWVFYRQHKKSIVALYVMNLDLYKRELVLVKVSGHLEKVIQKAMEDDRFTTDSWMKFH